MSLYQLSPNDILSGTQLPIVDALLEENDAAVVAAQLSSDELVSNEDIANTHDIILEGRAYESEESSSTDSLAGQVVKFDLFGIFTRGAINLVLPFINGVMLGLGEIFAHEIGFRWGFFGARVVPALRQRARY